MLVRLFAFIAFTLALIWLASIRPIIANATYWGFTFKLTHIGAFAVHFVLTWAVLKPLLRGTGRTLVASLLVSAAVGALIEVIQLYLPHRRGRASDMIQNAIGMAVGIAALLTWHGISALVRGKSDKT